MKRITKNVQNFMFFSILDSILKLSLEIIFKLIQTIKKNISFNNHVMIYKLNKLRVFW
jgi:hypothetical protein